MAAVTARDWETSSILQKYTLKSMLGSNRRKAAPPNRMGPNFSEKVAPTHDTSIYALKRASNPYTKSLFKKRTELLYAQPHHGRLTIPGRTRGAPPGE